MKYRTLLYIALTCVQFSAIGQTTLFQTTEAEIVEFVPRHGTQRDQAASMKNDFDVAYKTVERLVGKADGVITVNIYKDCDDLYDDLYTEYGYADAYSYLKRYNTIPRMDKDYVMWVPPGKGIDFLAHEYSHRVFEQIAGLGFQNACKWIDEGYATYIGLEALKEISLDQYQKARANQYSAFSNLGKNEGLIDPLQLRDITDWQALRINNKSPLAYIQSYLMIDYIAEVYGISKINQFLALMKGNADFETIFYKVFAMKDSDLVAEIAEKIEYNRIDYLSMESLVVESTKTEYIFSVTYQDSVPKSLGHDELYIEYDILIDIDNDRNTFSWGPMPNLANDLGVDYVASVILMRNGYTSRLLNKSKSINKKIKYVINDNTVFFHVEKDDIGEPERFNYIALSRQYKKIEGKETMAAYEKLPLFSHHMHENSSD